MVDGDTLRRSWRAWVTDDAQRIGPWWASFAWTIAFATVCALGFTIVSVAGSPGRDAATLPAWYRWFQLNLAVSLVITLTIRLLFAVSGGAIGRDRIAGWPRARRSLYYSLLAIVGVSIAWPLAVLWIMGIDVRRLFAGGEPGPIVASIGLAVLITAIFLQFFSSKTRQIQAENRAAEAQLRLLQGQMQPHFLFNTLANVVSLLENDPARAKAMLESFVDYLRASLSGLGETTHTLADEIALAEAYLRLAQMRMGDRLSYSIDVPTTLRDLAVPPLTLQPLVENAVVHGLEPAINGGRVRISARLEGLSLLLAVEDDGRGMRDGAPTGAGTALANTRKRLHHAFGKAATLELDAVATGGTRALLRLPAGR